MIETTRLRDAADRMVRARDAWLASTVANEDEAGAELDAAHEALRTAATEARAGLVSVEAVEVEVMLRTLLEQGHRLDIRTHVVPLSNVWNEREREWYERRAGGPFTYLPDGHAVGWYLTGWPASGERYEGPVCRTLREAVKEALAALAATTPAPALTAARLAWIQRGATLLEAVEWEDPTMGDEAERWVNDAHALVPRGGRAMSETTRPRTETGRTFLSMLETQDRLMALPGKVDWAHGIRAIEEAAAAEARAGLVGVEALQTAIWNVWNREPRRVQLRVREGEMEWLALDIMREVAALAATTPAPDPSDARCADGRACCCWPGACAGHVSGRTGHPVGVPCNEPSFHGDAR